MNNLNITVTNEKHQISILSPKPTGDYTGLYIILLLSTLLFILIFYVVYNLISYECYTLTRKHKRNPNFYTIEQCSDHLPIVRTKLTQNKTKGCVHSYEELIFMPIHQIPLRMTSLLTHQDF